MYGAKIVGKQCETIKLDAVKEEGGRLKLVQQHYK